MSQTTDSFEETEDRMSEGQLKYFGEPINQFPEPNVLMDKGNREMLVSALCKSRRCSNMSNTNRNHYNDLPAT